MAIIPEEPSPPTVRNPSKVPPPLLYRAACASAFATVWREGEETPTEASPRRAAKTARMRSDPFGVHVFYPGLYGIAGLLHGDGDQIQQSPPVLLGQGILPPDDASEV